MSHDAALNDASDASKPRLQNETRKSLWFGLSLLCNAGLLVYAHVGLSAVILSNQQRIPSSSERDASTAPHTVTTTTGACVAPDVERWTVGRGAVNKSRESNHCARHYVNPTTGSLCLLDVPCGTTCMSSVFGYTVPCAACFAQIPGCSLQDGCAVVCQQDDGTSPECLACTVDCNAQFAACSGLDLSYITASSNATNDTVGTGSNDTDATDASSLESSYVCARQQGDLRDLWSDDETRYHVVYEIQFLAAVKTAWTSNAPWLAILIAVFSGFWPYVKLSVMGVVYYVYLNASTEARTHQGLLMARWLRRWGKYTLVDIYVIVVILVGVALPIVVAGNVPVIIKGEPKGAIVAFLCATLWSFGQLEWMVHVAQSHDAVHGAAAHGEEPGQDYEAQAKGPAPNHTNTATNDVTARHVLDRMKFSTGGLVASTDRSKVWANPAVARCCLQLLLVASTALLVAGSWTELIRFSSVLGGEEGACHRRYTLYTLANVLISDFMTASSDGTAMFGLWTLYLAYVVCIGIVPLLVHAVHVAFFLVQIPVPTAAARWMFGGTHAAWTVASIEVLLLALFALQRKFDELMAALAGNDGSQFFGIESQLGPGFYLLLAYCFVGGLSQYMLNTALQQTLHPNDVMHRTDVIWTKLLCLVDEPSSVKTAAAPRGSKPIDEVDA